MEMEKLPGGLSQSSDPGLIKSQRLKAQIIVLNYNGGDVLRQCLPSIVQAAKQTTYATGVTVLDNGSTDRSREWVQENCPEVKWAKAPENLFLVSFNEYCQKIDDDIVILMNSDIRVDVDFVDPLIRVFGEYPDAFLVTSQCLSFDGTKYEGGRTRAEIRWGLFWSSALFPNWEKLRNKPGYTFASGFGAFHRKRFLALGGYDPLYLPGITEDADLGFRAWRQGYRSYYVPQSLVYHMGQASFKKAFGAKKVLTLAHRNSFLFVWKNISDPLLLVQHCLLLAPRLVFSTLRGKSELAIGFSQALGKLNKVLRVRKFPKKSARTDREIFKLANEEFRPRRYRFKKRWKCMLAAFFDFAGAIFFLIPSALRKFRRLNPKRILVIRTDSLGDAVMTLPAVRTLSKRFNEAKIDFLMSRLSHELYAYFFPSSRFFIREEGWWKTLKKIRTMSYDLVVDFRGDLGLILMMFFAGIPHRWGRGGTGGGFLLTHQITNPYTRHEVLENLELVSGNETFTAEFPEISLFPSEIRLPEEQKIIIHFGAGYPSKRWGVSHFVEVAQRIQERKLGLPIFIGSKEEGRLLDPYRSRLKSEYVDLSGQTTLGELLDVLRQADLFIGNDSGPAHLAALFNRPLLLIFSGTNDFRKWRPWTSEARIILNPVSCSPCEEKVCPLERQFCLDEISVDEVSHAAEEMLAR